MKCEKCQDVGFIEHNAGLLVEFCACEIGKEILAKKRAIYGIPDEVVQEGGIVNDPELGIVSRIEPDNTDTGSGDTGKPTKSSKPKKKKKARKRAK